MTKAMPNPKDIIQAAARQSISIATAESCTGGMIAAALTDIAGSSSAFDRGFVTYSNDAKHDQLGVPKSTIAEHGAVSQAVVLAMAEGAAIQVAGAKAISVSISGVAGPDGGTDDKPVGLVWFGRCVRVGDVLTTTAHQMNFSGDRASIRQAATEYGLSLVSDAL